MNLPDTYNALLVIVIVASVLCVLGVIADFLADRSAPPTLRGLTGRAGDPDLLTTLERKQREARLRLEAERAAAESARRERLAKFWDAIEGAKR